MSWLRDLLIAVWLPVAGICVIEYAAWVKRREEGEAKTFREAVRSVLPQQKAEYMPPMDDAEYEAFMEEQSSHGELMRKINENMPWNSRPPTSQS